MGTRCRLALALGLGLGLAMSGCSLLSDLTGADSVTVVPDVEGQWTGTFTTTTCTVSSDALQAYCALVVSTEPVGFMLTLAQFSEELVGSFQLGEILIPVSGSIDAAGRMVLAGSISAPVNGVGAVTITFRDWDTMVANAHLTGGWSSEAEASATGNTAQATHVIVDAIRIR
jgi:hypothetical protein